ncbi:MAG: MotA/TolQ/ExbB proton channel family protein [Steroidobacteraceae bacterium]|jgi:biopolymer transport protein ExbB|nr:MotA/TolQ/ExbB proton channel family protein [Gammaproteobacteria bacterium]
MWELISAGGPAMWPIILCSVLAMGITLERAWTLQRSRVLPADLLPKVRRLLEAGSVSDEMLTALERNSPFGRVLAAGLAARHRPRERMLERLQDAGRQVVHELDRFLNTLGTIASIAPLLGLLGTVTGIIRSFTAINQGAIGDPRLLSGGISEALITTAAGLMVAVPALVAYRLLRGRVDALALELERETIAFIDWLETREATRR